MVRNSYGMPFHSSAMRTRQAEELRQYEYSTALDICLAVQEEESKKFSGQGVMLGVKA